MHNSSGELAGRAECSRDIFTEPFGPEFAVGGATSEDEVRKRASRKGGLMDILESCFSSHISQFLCSHAFMSQQRLCVWVLMRRGL